MTRQEALDKLSVAVETNEAGSFASDEDAFTVAASALNYIWSLVNEDGSSDKSTD